MRSRIGTAVTTMVLLLLRTTPCLAQTTPTIANVTNAALPTIDLPVQPNVHVAPRSMVSIYGSGLSTATASTAPPWPQTLGGVQVHLIVDYVTAYNSTTLCSNDCELTASLTYVSPTLINFVTPDLSPGVIERARVVFIINGTRYDARFDVFGGPGLVYVDGLNYDFAAFTVGYDCLYSESLSNPSACGLSSSPGTSRGLLAAATDISGNLLSEKNPVRQGQVVILWATGITPLTLDTITGLLTANLYSLGFGIAQDGVVFPSTMTYIEDEPYGQFMAKILWAGESPSFPGADQINLTFPTCSGDPSTTAVRYDAFLEFIGVSTGTVDGVYLPFLVDIGDPDCQTQWANTTTTLTSSLNPASVGQTVIFTANVAPSTATGTVTFLDGNALLGSGTLSGGEATLSASLSAGTHSVTARYAGDSNYNSSTSVAQTQIINTKTSTTITLTGIPAAGGVSFIATVSPSNATGTVMFLDNGGLIGTATLDQPIIGGAELSGALLPGAHSITATYSGNNNYNGSTSFALLITGTATTITSSLNPSSLGQSVTFTATVSPSSSTGTVAFNGNGLPILCSSGTSLTNGQAKCSASLLAGTFSITAVYDSNNSNYAGSSAALTQTVH